MTLPVQSFKLLSFSDMAPGTLFRLRDTWQLKFQSGTDNTEFAVVLAGENAGLWYRGSAIAKSTCLAIAPGLWRAEFAGVDQVTTANATELALAFSPQGAAIRCRAKYDWGWVSLDGLDCEAAMEPSNFQTWLRSWSIALIDVANGRTQELFEIKAREA